MATFILIPGAGSDPQVHGATIDELRALGHDALAPPLPLGDPEALARRLVDLYTEHRPQ